MSINGDVPDGDPGSLDAAVDAVLERLAGGSTTFTPDAAAERWLGAGLRLGLERPGEARRLLALIEDQGAAAISLAGGPAPAAVDGTGVLPAAPLQSMLLARTAALEPADLAQLGREGMFGWASSLTSDQVLQLGRAVGDLLAAGA
ncbi:MAG: hypothetical protein WCK58_16410, partial [Chloroflexota bacterium]